MTKRLAVTAIVALAALGGVLVQPARAEGVNPIQARQAAFMLNGADFLMMRAYLAEKGDVKKLEVPAKAIANWATVIPTMFPKGSEKGDNTKALPAIWTDPSGFQKAAAGLHDAALKLAADAKSGDASAIPADLKAVGQACGACHKHYRAK